MKRIMFGLIWFLVFLFVSVFALGIIVGNSATDPQAGFEAGQAFGRTYGRYLVLGSLIAAVAGSWFQLLPGTKQRA